MKWQFSRDRTLESNKKTGKQTDKSKLIVGYPKKYSEAYKIK
jgi:hypothetical protein